MTISRESPSQNWAIIAYPSEKLELSYMDWEMFIHHAANLLQKKYPCVQAVASSPLHKPELSEEQLEALKQNAIEEYQKRLDKLLEKRTRNSQKLELKKADLKHKLEEQLADYENLQRKPHFHIQLRLLRKVRASSAEAIFDGLWEFLAINEFEELVTKTRVERITSASQYYNYLTHRDNLEKEQFELSPIVFPVGYKFTNNVGKSTFEEQNMRLAELEKLAYSGQFIDYAHLYKYVDEAESKTGILNWGIAKSILRNNQAHFDSLCRSYSRSLKVRMENAGTYTEAANKPFTDEEYKAVFKNERYVV